MKSLPKNKKAQQQQPKKPDEKPVTMALGAINYVMIALGAAVIAASYLGMYLEQKVDGFFSLCISPVTLIGSYLWIIFAILYRPEKRKRQKGAPV